MLEDVAGFVEAIRPAIEQELTPAQKKLRTPYGEERRTHLQCPLCDADMPQKFNRFSCPNRHGTLISARNLKKLRAQDVEFYDSAQANHTEGTLQCPSCDSVMFKVRYLGGKTIIDSCSNCMYRWLDNGEVVL